jgi:hypothetical protein
MKTKNEKETQQRTHENYVIAFTDGSVKVGTTGRSTQRITEIVSRKVKRDGVGVTAYYLGDILSRDEAYRVERDTCYLLRNSAIKGTREWFSKQTNPLDFFNYIKQTVRMFTQGVGLDRVATK